MKPEISAPGVWVRAARSKGNRPRALGSPWRTAATISKSGTSMAAPHLAGLIALMLQKKPGATIAELRSALFGEAREDPPFRNGDDPAAAPLPEWDPVYGAGRADAAAALRKLKP
jgi:subtilisin family serine protease